MTIAVTPTQVLTAVGVLLALALVWRARSRRARRAADATRAGVRVVSLAGRVIITAALLVGVQWVVITHPTGNPALLLVLLALPDLLAASVLTRALTVTTTDALHRGGGRR
ncbi:MAG: hypothetical protein GEV04_08585 [Actinophytocola sp.]|nr:hypothetical protein [Actinophytocola sp.]